MVSSIVISNSAICFLPEQVRSSLVILESHVILTSVISWRMTVGTHTWQENNRIKLFRESRSLFSGLLFVEMLVGRTPFKVTISLSFRAAFTQSPLMRDFVRSCRQMDRSSIDCLKKSRGPSVQRRQVQALMLLVADADLERNARVSDETMWPQMMCGWKNIARIRQAASRPEVGWEDYRWCWP